MSDQPTPEQAADALRHDADQWLIDQKLPRYYQATRDTDTGWREQVEQNISDLWWLVGTLTVVVTLLALFTLVRT